MHRTRCCPSCSLGVGMELYGRNFLKEIDFASEEFLTLADMLTMRDHVGKPLGKVCYCYVGNRGNVANSLLVTGALLGMDVRICGPQTRQPLPEIQKIAKALAAESGARTAVTSDVPTA